MNLWRRRPIVVATVLVLSASVLLGVAAFVYGFPWILPSDGGDGFGGRARGANETGTPAPASMPARCSGIRMYPGDDLQRASDAHPEGTTFCLTEGVHRLATVIPKSRQRFVGEGEGTILNGSKVMESNAARPDGAGHWYWGGQTESDEPAGKLVDPGHGETPNEGDRFAQELFVTSSRRVEDHPTRMRRVTALSELGPGRWYLDNPTGRLYVAEAPARLGLIERSVMSMAIGAPATFGPSDVTIENLVIEKYASPTQRAALAGPGSTDWTIRWVTVRYSHGTGIELGAGTLVEHCKIHHMGQEGLSGGGNAVKRPTIVRSTEVAYNRTLSFDPEWDAGGAKFGRVYGHGLVVENSWFHHNSGHGLWFDIDNDGVTIRSNRIEGNDRAGIFYEVSRNSQIYWNEVFGQTNGPDHGVFSGSGIFISNSAEVDVHHNLIRDNANGIYVLENRQITRWASDSYRRGLPHVDGVRIYDNDVQMPRGITGMRVESEGVVQKLDAVAYWRDGHVRFAQNTYRLDASEDRFLGPGNLRYTFAQWEALGHDRTSRALPAISRGLLPSDANPFVITDYGAWNV
ncbi:MAG TPA: right-handed parallel beta-helix repeat-containing protein [Kineosporiaceae bacterium]